MENAARVFGADNVRLFTRVLSPLLLPGMLVAVLGLAISLRYVTPSQAIRRRHR